MPEITDDSLSELRTKLAKAAKLLKNSETECGADTPEANFERQAARQALDAVFDFLKPLTTRNERKPLLELLGALEDAEHGRPNTLITPRKRHYDEPRVSIKSAVKLAYASYAVDLLITLNEEKEEALLRVAQILGVTKSELSASRYNIRSGRANKLAVEEYTRLIKLHADEKEPERLVQSFLNILQ
tara:strand:+ start:489 stop:1049 length:561 start_codon:yes stop_codon:yes gene_type:complete